MCGTDYSFLLEPRGLKTDPASAHGWQLRTQTTDAHERSGRADVL